MLNVSTQNTMLWSSGVGQWGTRQVGFQVYEAKVNALPSLATAYECAKAGRKVVVYEKSVFFNQGGSSGVSFSLLENPHTNIR